MMNYVEADRAAIENRSIDISATNKANIRKSGPHGFWAISFDRGRPPEALTGLYTSPMEAEKAVHTYLLQKGKIPE